MPKLVHNKTGEEIEVGSIHLVADELFELQGWEVPRSVNSTGRVSIMSVEDGHTDILFPGSIDAKVVDFCPACRMDSDDFSPIDDPDYNTVCGACGWKLNDPRNNKPGPKVYRRRRPRREIEKRVKHLQGQAIRLEFEMSQPKGYGRDSLKSQYMGLATEIKILNWVLMEE